MCSLSACSEVQTHFPILPHTLHHRHSLLHPGNTHTHTHHLVFSALLPLIRFAAAGGSETPTSGSRWSAGSLRAPPHRHSSTWPPFFPFISSSSVGGTETQTPLCCLLCRLLIFLRSASSLKLVHLSVLCCDAGGAEGGGECPAHR